MSYSFTCPLEGCGLVMSANTQNTEEAVKSLVKQAEEHLSEVHPDIKKSHAEVDLDIRSHMISN